MIANFQTYELCSFCASSAFFAEVFRRSSSPSWFVHLWDPTVSRAVTQSRPPTLNQPAVGSSRWAVPGGQFLVAIVWQSHSTEGHVFNVTCCIAVGVHQRHECGIFLNSRGITSPILNRCLSSGWQRLGHLFANSHSSKSAHCCRMS